MTAAQRYAQVRARLAGATMPRDTPEPSTICRPIWDVPTTDGVVTRHGWTYAEACAGAEACGLTVIADVSRETSPPKQTESQPQ